MLVSLPTSSDYRAVIDSGVSDFSAEVEVKVDDYGDQMFGVVARYSGEHDWIMAFHDGADHIVLGKKVNNELANGDEVDPENLHAGGFQEMGRFAIDMSERKKAHKIKIVTSGDTIQVYANGDLILTRPETDHTDNPNATKVGVFSRAVGVNRFDKFTVSQDGGGGGKGGGKPSKKGASAPEPSTAPGGDDDDDDDEDEGKRAKSNPPTPTPTT